MSTAAIARTGSVVGVLLSFVLLTTGCRGTAFIEGGPEIRYLTSKPPAARKAMAGRPMLPLTVGNHWEMRFIGSPKLRTTAIDARIVKSDSEGSLMEIRKNGQPWRREIYRDTASGLFLIAMGEDDKPLMRLSPPVPLIRYPIHEGDGQNWNGTFRYGDLTYSAASYSRVSALETVSKPQGRDSGYRIDTLLQLNQGEALIKFPTIRWLVPGTGFVRRSFVEQGRPVFAELRKFTPA